MDNNTGSNNCIRSIDLFRSVREDLLYYLWWTRPPALEITHIQANMPYESSEDSSNQPDGPMGSPRHPSWPHRTPKPPLDPLWTPKHPNRPLISPFLPYKWSEDPSIVPVDPIEHLRPPHWSVGLPLDPLGPWIGIKDQQAKANLVLFMLQGVSLQNVFIPALLLFVLVNRRKATPPQY